MDATANNVHIIEDAEGQRIQIEFQRFIEEFVDPQSGKKCYLDGIAELVKPERNTLVVDFEHIGEFSGSLKSALELQFYRLYPFICRALQLVTIDQCRDDAYRHLLHRKELYVSITNASLKCNVRELTADKIGALVCISGQIVRTHPVHPELCRGTFVCADCGSTTRTVEQQFRYTQPSQCSNPGCLNRNRFRLDVYQSMFVDFQKLRVQENQDELPRGSIPRSVEIILRGECVETAQPGDRCHFIGTLIVVPDVAQLSTPGIRAEASNRNRGKAVGGYEADGLRGLKALGVRDLNYRMAFLACNVSANNQRFGGKDYSHEDVGYAELWNKMTDGDKTMLKSMSDDKHIVQNLVNSMFPGIYGSDEVKQGTLLMLFGGVAKRTAEGTSLRGDINVCLVGDPSTAKSQILKKVEEYAPRAVYTSGKASSAAGLTAAVVKDEESFEFVIEAGALMLADNGVCCIDEFDKMDTRDQVAIHEAMEQQTISITKAGVKATLNARTSILAAANPIGGRYDRSRSLRQNIQLSAPIMSRFDLFFVMIDECNEIVDYAIASRILDTHRCEVNDEPIRCPYKKEDIQKYIMFARCFKPTIGNDAAEALVEQYKLLRQHDSNGASSSWRITVRQLESLIRLSEALARLHCEREVSVDHVRRASSLLNKSIVRVEQPDIALDNDEMTKGTDVTTTVVDDEMVAPDDATDADDGDAMQQMHQKLSIPYEKYKCMTDVLVAHIREREELTENEDDEGIRQSALIDWYLDQNEAALENEQQYTIERTIVERVIRLLIADDGVLIALKTDNDDDPILVVHPNYIVHNE